MESPRRPRARGNPDPPARRETRPAIPTHSRRPRRPRGPQPRRLAHQLFESWANGRGARLRRLLSQLSRVDGARRRVQRARPGDPAGKEFDDLVDAVDHLISIGLVDKDKVGITGGSYGGYATAWCCTRYTDRFAAGVMFVGISDLVSKIGTTDIPNEELLVHARKPVAGRLASCCPRAQPDLLRRQTPTLRSSSSAARTTRASTRGRAASSIATSRWRGEAPVRLVLIPRRAAWQSQGLRAASTTRCGCSSGSIGI